jgi:ribokinase
LSSFLQDIRPVRAVVIGNIALDETFRVPALPAPGETLLASAAGVDLGGKGANQAVVLARCGVPTRLVARIGADAAAAQLRALLAAEPLDISGLIAAGAATDRSVVLVTGEGDNAIISIADCARGLTTAEAEAALAGAAPGDILLVQGNLTMAVTRHALEVARRRGLHTVFNPAPVAPKFATLWPLVDLAVLNAGEARCLSGAAEATRAAERIHAQGAGIVVVTLGAGGALLRDAVGTVRQAAVPVVVRDTTGAGDTFAAVLAAALLVRRLPTPVALRAAAEAAALTVSRAGTLVSFPSAAELATILDGA